ncbi:MAG TPA: 2-phospho-L-lactate transferase [Pseudolabrys sp.]|nr:2-phospho-L-lactate transferase [Pseudolabrys sp.]
MTLGAQKNQVVALCGGIGGAKLVLGLSRLLAPGELTVIVNTGDDFEHLGLHISPDIDTVVYTLAGLADPVRGWGRAHETWNFMQALNETGGPTWFSLGDLDLAMHASRTAFLRDGGTLSAFTRQIGHTFGIPALIVPMSDDAVRTIVQTEEGDLPFQHYFVRRRCEPVVKAIRFEGARSATPASGVLEMLTNPGLRAVIVCPSNPYLSIDPILSVPGMRKALAQSRAPVIVVSPIIGGQAVKGPTAKIMRELALSVTTATIAEHYRGLMNAVVIDKADSDEAERAGVPVLVTSTMMKDLADRERLARATLDFADDLRQAISESERVTADA